jgi:hypothetical protein
MRLGRLAGRGTAAKHANGIRAENCTTDFLCKAMITQERLVENGYCRRKSPAE